MQFLSAQRRNNLVGRYIPFTKQVVFEQHMIDSFKSSSFQNSKLCQEKPHCFARNDIAGHTHMFAFHHGKSTVLVIWNLARANDNPGEYRLQTDNKKVYRRRNALPAKHLRRGTFPHSHRAGHRPRIRQHMASLHPTPVSTIRHGS